MSPAVKFYFELMAVSAPMWHSARPQFVTVSSSHVLQAPAALASILKPLEVLTRPLPIRQRPSDDGAQGEQHANGQEGQAGRAGAQAGPRAGRTTAAQDQVCWASRRPAAPHQVCLPGRSSAVQSQISLVTATIQPPEATPSLFCAVLTLPQGCCGTCQAGLARYKCPQSHLHPEPELAD